jgi:hypothetical protein
MELIEQEFEITEEESKGGINSSKNYFQFTSKGLIRSDIKIEIMKTVHEWTNSITTPKCWGLGMALAGRMYL